MNAGPSHQPIYTIGHSTRTLAEFHGILDRYQIQLLADVRTIPRSRHVPHFNADALASALRVRGISYLHLKNLGGLRKPAGDSPNRGWRNLSFRGFADYMQTEEFWQAVGDLLDLSADKKVALMCAEAVPWRCHRSLISDALLTRHVEVRHIISKDKCQPHKLTLFALLQGDRITYPVGQES